MDGRIEGYEMLKPLGSHPHNTFIVQRSRDGEKMVAKVVNYKKYDKFSRRIIAETVNSLVQLRCNSIVRYHNCVLDNEHLFLIVDYCKNGNLFSYLQSDRNALSEDKIWDMVADIALALYECHEHKPNRIIHGNLSTNNVFLDDNYNVKIGNFALNASDIGKEKDIIGLGFIIYELASGSASAKDNYPNQAQISNLSDGFKEILNGIFAKNFTLLDILEFPEVSLKILEKKIKVEKDIYEREKAKYLRLKLSLNS